MSASLHMFAQATAHEQLRNENWSITSCWLLFQTWHDASGRGRSLITAEQEICDTAQRQPADSSSSWLVTRSGCTEVQVSGPTDMALLLITHPACLASQYAPNLELYTRQSIHPSIYPSMPRQPCSKDPLLQGSPGAHGLRTCLAAPPAGAPSAALLPVAALALGREASRVAWALEAASTSAAEPRVSAAVTARALSSSRSAAGRAPSPGATARAYRAATRDAVSSPETCSSRWMAPWQPQGFSVLVLGQWARVAQAEGAGGGLQRRAQLTAGM